MDTGLGQHSAGHELHGTEVVLLRASLDGTWCQLWRENFSPAIRRRGFRYDGGSDQASTNLTRTFAASSTSGQSIPAGSSHHAFARSPRVPPFIRHIAGSTHCGAVFPGSGSGAVFFPWSSPRLQHHAAAARKIHLPRLFRFPQPSHLISGSGTARL